MNKTKLWIVFFGGFVIMISAWLLARGIMRFREGQPQINVTGLAEKQITSDLIVWNITINSKSDTRANAYSDFKKTSRRVREYLSANGIPDSILSLSSVDILPETKSLFDPKTQQYMQMDDGYRVSQTLTVRSKNLGRVESVYQKISELYNEGLNFSSSAPLYYYTRLSDLKMEMLNKASENAYERAQTIAKGSNSSIGSIVSSSMGVFQIVGLNSNEEYSWGGTFNTSSKEKVASITVRTSYQVD